MIEFSKQYRGDPFHEGEEKRCSVLNAEKNCRKIPAFASIAARPSRHWKYQHHDYQL
jgi:hypothetical protein